MYISLYLIFSDIYMHREELRTNEHKEEDI